MAPALLVLRGDVGHLAYPPLLEDSMGLLGQGQTLTSIKEQSEVAALDEESVERGEDRGVEDGVESWITAPATMPTN
jgi:hypothetical protein